MDIKRSGSQASKKSPEDYFSGVVRVDAPFSGSGNLSGATVTLEPGARTAWHTHPLGQTLLVTAGLGRVQREAVQPRSAIAAMLFEQLRGTLPVQRRLLYSRSGRPRGYASQRPDARPAAPV
jgi:hypothetical protein